MRWRGREGAQTTPGLEEQREATFYRGRGRHVLTCGFVLGVADSLQPAKRSVLGLVPGSMQERVGRPPGWNLVVGRRSGVLAPVPLVVLPAACCVMLERSLHSVGGWVWLWEAGEVLRWHRVAFVTDFTDILALSKGCLCASSWSHAMLHDSQRALSIGYGHSTPAAYRRTLRWPAIPFFRFMAAGDSVTAHVACLTAAERQG